MLLLVGITMRVQFISELIGTFCMVFIGCLAVKEGQGEPVISLAFGGAVCAVIIVSRRFSGAHINPAVSIAFAISGELDRERITSLHSCSNHWWISRRISNWRVWRHRIFCEF